MEKEGQREVQDWKELKTFEGKKGGSSFRRNGHAEHLSSFLLLSEDINSDLLESPSPSLEFDYPPGYKEGVIPLQPLARAREEDLKAQHCPGHWQPRPPHWQA